MALPLATTGTRREEGGRPLAARGAVSCVQRHMGEGRGPLAVRRLAGTRSSYRPRQQCRHGGRRPERRRHVEVHVAKCQGGTAVDALLVRAQCCTADVCRPAAGPASVTGRGKDEWRASALLRHACPAHQTCGSSHGAWEGQCCAKCRRTTALHRTAMRCWWRATLPRCALLCGGGPAVGTGSALAALPRCCAPHPLGTALGAARPRRLARPRRCAGC